MWIVLLKDDLLCLRERLGLRQKEMAEKLGVSYGTYRSWEYGKKTPKALALGELKRRMNALTDGK